MYHPNVTLSHIPDTLPVVGEPIVLPGAEPSNTVTPKQFAVIISHAKEVFPSSMTFAEAISQLRAKYVRGRQKDWNIIDGIRQDAFAKNASNPLTSHSGGQNDLLATIISALSGEKSHWDTNINARIQSAPPSIRNAMLQNAISITNQGELNLFMTKFSALFGKPTPRAGFGEPLNAETVLGITKSETDISEPF